MKGVTALFLGIFGTFAFSWAGLTLIPNFQIGHLDPQADEEGTDIYPVPKSGMAERGRKIYAANGCVYCHSQQVRADYAASDIDRARALVLRPHRSQEASAAQRHPPPSAQPGAETHQRRGDAARPGRPVPVRGERPHGRPAREVGRNAELRALWSEKFWLAARPARAHAAAAK